MKGGRERWTFYEGCKAASAKHSNSLKSQLTAPQDSERTAKDPEQNNTPQ